ncbi:hypothetical protein GBA52_028878 [Prunus armeniaca]|nr:hypothetical protein GBA52_028878 [Prunus armeniaca]
MIKSMRCYRKLMMFFKQLWLGWRKSSNTCLFRIGNPSNLSTCLSVQDSLQRDSVSRASEEVVIDLVHPDVVPELRGIANLMFNCNYDQECIQAYTSIRGDALDECLSILEVQRLSIEDVLKMEWGCLNSKIRRWVWVMKIFCVGLSS